MQISEAQRIQTALERLTQGRAANLDNLDALISSRSSHAPGAIWTEATRTLTNPGVASDLANMQVAISPTATGRAANLDNLDALISSRSSHAAVDVRQSVTAGTDPLDSIGRRIFDNLDKSIASLNDLSAVQVNAEVDSALDTAIPGVPTADSINERVAALDDNYTAARAANLDNLDALISSRSSHGAVDVRQSVTAGTDPLNSIGRRIFDNLDAAISGIPTNPALDTNYTAARSAYLDNLIGSQTAGTYSHPSGTLEEDAVVVTPTELGKYEKLCLDFNGLAQTTTVRTYVQVDGLNYRLVDSAEYPTDFPTNTAAVVIDLTPGDRTMKVTLQSGTAEGVAVDVPYFYVERSLA